MTPLQADRRTAVPKDQRGPGGMRPAAWRVVTVYRHHNGEQARATATATRQADAIAECAAAVDAALSRGTGTAWAGVTADTLLADATRAWLDMRTSDNPEDLTRVHGETERVYGYVVDYIERGLHLAVGEVTHKAARDFIYLQRRPTDDDIAREQEAVEARRKKQQKVFADWERWTAARRASGLPAYPLPDDVTAAIEDVDPETLLYPSRSEMAWVVLRGVFETLADNGVIDHNPMREISKPKLPQAQPAEPRVLRGEQVAALMRAVQAYTETETLRTPPPRSEWLVPQLALLLTTGLRISEVNALRWEDIDTSDPRLWWVTPHRRKKRDRSGSVERVALPPSVIPVLRRWRSQQQLLSPWVLPMRGDPTRHMSRSGKTFTAAVEWARLPHRSGDDVAQADRELLPAVISYHDLRHTVATAMAATGNAALATLQLGHASASTTEAAYINRAGDVDNSAILEPFVADALKIFG